MLGAANRDPVVFANPDRLDITRNVRGIVSFGMGIHFCLGAALARLGGEVAFASLATHLPQLRLAGPPPAWRDGVVLRGLRSLPVEWQDAPLVGNRRGVVLPRCCAPPFQQSHGRARHGCPVVLGPSLVKLARLLTRVVSDPPRRQRRRCAG